MGYDVNRFIGEISEELICSICSEVLESPLTTDCEHLFCRECITDWLRHNNTCPIDRLYLSQRTLKTAPRTIRNLLGKLEIHCDYEPDGCQKVVYLELLDKHVIDCYYNPKKMLSCEMGCERVMTREELRKHNCWNDIKRDMLNQQSIILDLKRQRSALICLVFMLLFYILCPWILFKFYFENLFVALYEDNSNSNSNNNKDQL